MLPRFLANQNRKQARNSSNQSRINQDINACNDISDIQHLRATKRKIPNKSNASDYYADLALDIQTSRHLQNLGRSPMSCIYDPEYLTQALNPTITDNERIIGYNDEQLDHFIANNTQTMNLFSAVSSLLEENKPICESTLKAKNNVVMKMIPYLFGMNRKTSKVVNSLKMAADQENDNLFLSMNPDQTLHKYIFMGQVRQAVVDNMLIRQPDDYVNPIDTKGELIVTGSTSSSMINFDNSLVQGDKHLLCEPMIFNQRNSQPFKHDMFFPSPFGQHLTDMSQNYTAYTVLVEESDDLFLNPSALHNMIYTENAKQQSVNFISNGHTKEQTPEIDLSEATLQTIRFGALMLNTIQNKSKPPSEKWWSKQISVADIVDNLECANFSISKRLSNDAANLTMRKADLTKIVKNIVDSWCDASVGDIVTKDDLALFKQNPSCSHIFKMLQICKNKPIIKNSMTISDKHITEANENDFIQQVLPKLNKNEWKSMVEAYLKCWYIPITKLLMHGRCIRTRLTNVYMNQIKGKITDDDIGLKTSFTFFYPTDMNYSTKIYALLGSYVRHKTTNDWTIIPGTVFDFNLVNNHEFNPDDIEPTLSTLKTVNADTSNCEEILNNLFIHDYAKAENKNSISKYVGHEFDDSTTTKRCVKVNPSCIKTDRDALITPEFIKEFETQCCDSDAKLDQSAVFTNTLTDEHSPYGSDLSILIKARYAATIARMLSYSKNDEAVLNFFNQNSELKQFMVFIDIICFAPRNKAKVVMTQNNADKNSDASEGPKTFMYMRFFMLNQLMNLAASFTKNKATKSDLFLGQLLPFTMKETPEYQQNQPLWTDSLESLYGDTINVNCSAITVGRYVQFFEQAVALFAELDNSRKVSLSAQDKQALAGYITIANHYLFSVTSLDLASGNTEIETTRIQNTGITEYSFQFNPVIGEQLTEKQQHVLKECPQIFYFQKYRAITPSGSKHVNVLSQFETFHVFSQMKRKTDKQNNNYCCHLQKMSAYNALLNLNAVSDTTARLQFKSFDDFMPIRYKDITKDATVSNMLAQSQPVEKYSVITHLFNLSKCTEICRIVHIASISALKLIESCAMGVTGDIPVYYVDQNKIVRNLTRVECTKLYKYLKESKTISPDLLSMGEKIFGTNEVQNKWLVNHVQPFEITDQIPIINCMFSDKFIPYISKQYCLTDDFYNQLQGKLVKTQGGWQVNSTCTPRKDLMQKILTTANAPQDIGIIDINKKTFFSFCSSQTMARAYQYTIFQLVKKSLGALNFSEVYELFKPQSFPRTARILNNVNNKLALLKGDGIKLIDLSTPINKQYKTVVVPFQQLVELGLTYDNKYISASFQIKDEDDELVFELQNVPSALVSQSSLSEEAKSAANQSNKSSQVQTTTRITRSKKDANNVNQLPQDVTGDKPSITDKKK